MAKRRLLSKAKLSERRESLQQRLASLTSAGLGDSAHGGSAELETLLDAAALHAQFVPENLAKSVGVGLSKELAESLNQRSAKVDSEYPISSRELTDSARRTAIERFTKKKSAEKLSSIAALEESSDVRERILGKMLSGVVPSIDELSGKELAAASSWNQMLTGIADVFDQVQLDRAVERDAFITSLDKLIGGKFAGRTAELEMLDFYIEHGCIEQSEVNEYRPLLISGPGGMGKSTLLAHFLLTKVCDVVPPRYPFAYLDFDRRILSIEYPATLLNDVLRQLAIFYPEHRESFLQFRDTWRERLQIGNESAKQYAQGTRDLESTSFSDAGASYEFIYEFVRQVQSTGILDDKPLVLVLDTFEEVQGRSRDYLERLGEFLEQLRSELESTDLRVILSGRVEVNPAHFTTHERVLDELDEEASEFFLRELGVHPSLTPRVIKQVSAVPLTLRFASEVILPRQDHLLKLGEMSNLDPIWYELRDDRLLYQRYLDQIHDDDVKKLAHPGLVLRVVTPAIIEDFLAELCGITLADNDSASNSGTVPVANGLQRPPRTAREVFDALSRQVSLVSSVANDVLKHRREVRKMLLPLIKEDEAAKVKKIHKRAVQYYEGLGDTATVQQRAEELYHRLQLGSSQDVIDARWMPGVETELCDCVDELPPESQVILAPRLGGAADAVFESMAGVDLQQIDQIGWELYAIRKAQTSIKFNTPQEALAVLADRTERLPGSQLYPLEATLYKHASDWAAMRETAIQGLQSAACVGNREMAVELLNILFQSFRLPGDFDGALSVMKTARQLIPEGDDAESLSFHLRLDLFELQIADLTQVSNGPLNKETVLWRVRELLAQRPTGKFAGVCRSAAGTLGKAYPDVVEKVLHRFGIDPIGLNEPRVRLLTEAFSVWDALVSTERGEHPGLLAREHDLFLSSESHWQGLEGEAELRLVEALPHLFPSRQELEAFLVREMAVSMTQFVGPSSTLRTVVFDTVRYLGKLSRVGEFVRAVTSAFPSDHAIQQVVSEIAGEDATHRSAWESLVRKLADGKRVPIKTIIRKSIHEFGLPAESAATFAQFFALPDESAAFAPAYAKLLGSLDGNSLDLLAQRVVGIDLIDRSDKAKTLLRAAYEQGQFQNLIDSAHELIGATRHGKGVRVLRGTKVQATDEIATPFDTSADGEAWRSLLKGFMDAFPSSIDLQELLRSVSDDLSHYGTAFGDQHATTARVLENYSAGHRLDKLVHAAIAKRPDNGSLRAAALELGIEKQLPSTQSDVNTGGGSLDRMLHARRGFANPMNLLEGLGAIVNTVCKVIIDDTPAGTGFLISDDVLLTNYHVVRNAIKEQLETSSSRVTLRFDYHSSADGTVPGAEFALVDGDEWLVDVSEMDRGDAKFRSRKETLSLSRAPDRLDYALLRVAGRPGETTIGPTKRKRGFVAIPETGPDYKEVLQKDAGMFIFQHPRNADNKEALSLHLVSGPANIEFNDNQTRLVHSLGTLAGASGSPCFNQRLELIAVHHMGGEESPEASGSHYGQAIPINKIRELLKSRGKWDEIYS